MMTGAINLISRIKKDELFRGSFVLVIMIGLYNFFNYLFQLSMARMLTLTEYSIFSVLMSLVYIIAIPSEAIQTIIAKNTSKLNAERNTGKIKYLILEGLKKGIIYSGIIFILSIPILFVISSLLKIKISLILITMLSVIFAFTLSITRGALQGNKKFFKLGLNSSLESFFKLLFSIFLVYIGLEVYGAIVAVLIGATIALFFSYLSLKDIFKQKKEKCEFNGLLKQNMPILIIMTSIVLIYSLDVIFARIFFSPDLAGKYSFVSLIGKTILFMGFAIGKTMLPISSGNFEKRRGTFGLFKKSFLMISIISLVALLVFYFFQHRLYKYSLWEIQNI